MPKDFSSITEFPGKTVGRDQFKIIGRRYRFAADLAVGKRVLEVGCGPGLGLGCLTRVAASVVAGDVTTAALARAGATYHGRRGLHLVQFDGQVLPFRDSSFDLVLAMAMMMYLDAEAFLMECRRVLAVDGILAFCMPNKNALGFRPSRFSTQYYSVAELIEMARRHGFDLQVFGGFAAPRGRGQLVQRAIALGGTALAVLAFTPKLYERAKGMAARLIGYEIQRLADELTPEHIAMVEDISVVPLGPESENAQHRILYGVASRRGGDR